VRKLAVGDQTLGYALAGYIDAIAHFCHRYLARKLLITRTTMTDSINDQAREWDRERAALLDRPISSLGLTLRGTMLERLYAELAEHALVFRPPIYLSDEWGCRDGIARIGVPFYLADERLRRIEEEFTGEVEDETESMRYLRDEAGHAFN
jgi:hypothetical protein